MIRWLPSSTTSFGQLQHVVITILRQPLFYVLSSLIRHRWSSTCQEFHRRRPFVEEMGQLFDRQSGSDREILDGEERRHPIRSFADFLFWYSPCNNSYIAAHNKFYSMWSTKVHKTKIRSTRIVRWSVSSTKVTPIKPPVKTPISHQHHGRSKESHVSNNKPVWKNFRRASTLLRFRGIDT